MIAEWFHKTYADVGVPALLFVILALGLGAVISADDWRTRKIRNKWIAGGVCAGVMLHAGLFAFYHFFVKDVTVKPDYLLAVLLNGAMGFACGYALWKLRVWSAGDSKLFFLFAFLVPLEFYSGSFMAVFPAFSLLVNIFLVSFGIVTWQAAAHFVSGGGQDALAQAGPWGVRARKGAAALAARWPSLVVSFCVFNALYAGMIAVQRQLHSAELSVLLNIGFLVVMFAVLGPVLGRQADVFSARPWLRTAAPLAAVGVLAALALSPGTRDMAVRNVKMIAGYMIVVGLVRSALDAYVQGMDARRIKVRDLRPGHVPAPGAGEALLGEGGRLFMDGLSAAQVKQIQERLDPDQEIEAVDTIPFAPMALAGVVVTLLLRQSLLHLILGSLGR